VKQIAKLNICCAEFSPVKIVTADIKASAISEASTTFNTLFICFIFVGLFEGMAGIEPA